LEAVDVALTFIRDNCRLAMATTRLPRTKPVSKKVRISEDGRDEKSLNIFLTHFV
jgi:hypothetical protein